LGGVAKPSLGGRYYLESHGVSTEVTELRWKVVSQLNRAFLLGWVIAGCGILLSAVSFYARRQIYAQATDYSALVTEVLVFGMIMLVVGNVLAPK
jgi:hypothetical protein